jgi:hypothetical protein
MERSHSIAYRIPSAPRGMVRAAVLFLCLIAAAAALRRIVVLLLASGPAGPPQMSGLDADFASRRVLTLFHIVPALLLVAVLVVKLILRGRLSADRQRQLSLGLMALGVIVGLTALAMSLHPVGGLLEASAAVSYDLLFLFALGRAGILLRRGDVGRYREWLVRAIAVLLGIATTRPVMGIFFATQRLTHLQPSQFFGMAFWIGFTLTWAAGEIWLRMQLRRSGEPALSPVAAAVGKR